MLFSLRNKLLDDDAMLSRFRNRVWNTFSDLLDIYYDSCSLRFDMNDMNSLEAAYTLLFDIADTLGLDVADRESDIIYKMLHLEISSAPKYNYVYDFIEANLKAIFCHSTLSCGVQGLNLKRVQDATIEKYSQLLKDENQPYQLRNEELIPLVSDFELAEIEAATATDYNSVNKHIEKAWSFFASRKSPDYENSIKESISAVEAMCCIITGMTGTQATLGNALKKLEETGVHIHGGMKNAFSSLYGYTSDESGIRHGRIDFTSAPAEDAKYMLVTCSAFVNYLIEKWRSVNS